MVGGGVAPILMEAVDGVLDVIAIHAEVPCDLRQDRRRGDTATETVPVDQGALWKAERGNREAVDDHVIRLRAQPLDRAAHRPEGCAADVPTIDPGGSDRRDPPRLACGQNYRNQTASL